MAVENLKSNDIQELIKAFETDINFVQSLPDNSSDIQKFGWEETVPAVDKAFKQADNDEMRNALTTFKNSLPQGDIDQSRGHLNAIRRLQKMQENQNKYKVTPEDNQCFEGLKKLGSGIGSDKEMYEYFQNNRSIIQKWFDLVPTKDTRAGFWKKVSGILTDLNNGQKSDVRKYLNGPKKKEENEEKKREIEEILNTMFLICQSTSLIENFLVSRNKDIGFLQNTIPDITPDITPDSLDQDKGRAQQLLGELMGRGLRYGGDDENGKYRTGEETRKMYCDNWLNSFGGKNPEGAILLFFRQLTSPGNLEYSEEINDPQRQQYLANLLHLFSPEEQLSMIFHLFADKDKKDSNLTSTYIKNYDITSDTNYEHALNFFSQKLTPSFNIDDATSFLYNGDEHVKDLLINFKKELGFDRFKEEQLTLAQRAIGNGDFTYLLNDENLPGEKRENLQRIINDRNTRKNSSVKNTVASN